MVKNLPLPSATRWSPGIYPAKSSLRLQLAIFDYLETDKWAVWAEGVGGNRCFFQLQYLGRYKLIKTRHYFSLGSSFLSTDSLTQTSLLLCLPLNILFCKGFSEMINNALKIILVLSLKFFWTYWSYETFIPVLDHIYLLHVVTMILFNKDAFSIVRNDKTLWWPPWIATSKIQVAYVRQIPSICCGCIFRPLGK